MCRICHGAGVEGGQIDASFLAVPWRTECTLADSLPSTLAAGRGQAPALGLCFVSQLWAAARLQVSGRGKRWQCLVMRSFQSHRDCKRADGTPITFATYSNQWSPFAYAVLYRELLVSFNAAQDSPAQQRGPGRMGDLERPSARRAAYQLGEAVAALVSMAAASPGGGTNGAVR